MVTQKKKIQEHNWRSAEKFKNSKKKIKANINSTIMSFYIPKKRVGSNPKMHQKMKFKQGSKIG